MDDQDRRTVRSSRPDRLEHITELMNAARCGSEDALGQIVTELSPLLWHVTRATGLSPCDAEDVLQTVWMRLVAHLDDDEGAKVEQQRHLEHRPCVDATHDST